MKLNLKPMKLANVILLMMILSGCKSISVKTDCAWVKPISWSDADTAETKDEIFRHNLKYEDICNKVSV